MEGALHAFGGHALPTPSLVLGSSVLVLSLARWLWPLVDEVLALVPHHTVFSPVATWPVPFLWNVATAHFFEAHLLKAAISTPLVVFLAQLLERLWTPRAVALHVGFTAACSGGVTFLAELVHVYRTHHERDFFVPIRGCAGLLVSLAVALRHAYPLESLPLLPKSWGLQCQHLPFGIAAVVCLMGLLAPPGAMLEWLFAPLSLFFAWLHLRYVMWFPYAGAHGDHSQDFCFAALFPRALRPLVSCTSAIVYALAVLVAPGYLSLRLPAEGEVGHPIVYDPRGDGELELAAGSQHPPGPALDPTAAAGAPGSQEYHARRAKALQLLDANISSLGLGFSLSGDSAPGPSTGVVQADEEPQQLQP